MTSNQRRPGFRLPWSTEEEAAAAEASKAQAGSTAPTDSQGTPAAGQTGSEEPELEAPAAGSPAAAIAAAPSARPAPATRPAAEAAAPAAPTVESSAGFMRDLVAAMRRVAEETRQAGLSDLRTKSEARVRSLEADSERRREELRSAAESEIAGVGEWARKEQERITLEAEQRVVGRRAQLDQQLAAETSRAETEAQALRDRVAEYERELDAYHAQLSDIADPAAFAAAAKRMPAPPRLAAGPAPAAPAQASAATPPTEPKQEPDADEEPTSAGTEVLSARLAELDATLEPSAPQAEPAAETAAAPRGETVATEVLVKGLGSFGAITGFRQALASVDQIDGVSLDLGPTGEFVFRAIHPVGFDVAAAITGIEGDAATIEERPEGGLRVTLDRAR
jgi:hypothetical protein